MTILRAHRSYCVRLSIVASLSALSLYGCGGGGGGGGGLNSANFSSGGGTTLASGQFVDQVVSGLQYTSGAQSGLTDDRGAFVYEVGRNATFSVGGVVLGSVQGKDLVTPVSLVSGSDASDPRVRNIARFLMMLDQDQNPSNGITISPAVRAAAAAWTTPDFSSPTFETDANVIAIVASANVADGGTPAKSLPSSAAAEGHLTSSIRCAYTGMYSGDWSGTYQPAGTHYNGSWRSVVDPVSGIIAGRSLNNFNYYWTQSGDTTTSENGNYVVTATGFSMTGTLAGDNMSGNWTDTVQVPNNTGTGTMSGTRQSISLPTGASGTAYRGVAYGLNNLPSGYRTLVTLLFTINANVVSGTAIAEHYIPESFPDPAQLVLAQYGVVGSVTGSSVNAQIVDTLNNPVATGTGTLAADGTLSGSWSSSVTGENGPLSACRAF